MGQGLQMNDPFSPYDAWYCSVPLNIETSLSNDTYLCNELSEEIWIHPSIFPPSIVFIWSNNTINNNKHLNNVKDLNNHKNKKKNKNNNNNNNNNPLRFETTKCSKQRVEQASARTLFPKCVHKLGSPRFVLEAVSWSTAIAGHVLSPAQGAALSSKGFLSFQFMKCPWLRGQNA